MVVGACMKFLREISVQNSNDVVINNLEQEGFTLIWKESSIEIWYEMASDEKAARL
jgi:hypothetical protein